MAEFQHAVQPDFFLPKQVDAQEIGFVPYWARSQVQYAQNLLECSDEPIVYDDEDEDYQDNCFFFPEDCSWSPPKDWVTEDNTETETETDTTGDSHTVYSDYQNNYDDDDDNDMIPGLPDIKMLDAEALRDLLEDNLSPPEITSILVFSTNGAIFAHASLLPSRQLRNLSATYGAAYTCYAKTISSGNLTGVNPTSHPSSYVTAQSISLGDVGSIVFELDDSVAVVTRIADKVLLAAVGPSKSPNSQSQQKIDDININNDGPLRSGSSSNLNTNADAEASPTPTGNNASTNIDSLATHLETQYQIDRSSDLARLESLNLSASPAILLALESKSAALGKFLGQKLADLESPEDF